MAGQYLQIKIPIMLRKKMAIKAKKAKKPVLMFIIMSKNFN
jgi:hypothetical protein